MARLMVGSLGISDLVCEAHLTARSRQYEQQLLPFQVVSLVKIPEGLEREYAATLHNLVDSERATVETMNALRIATAKCAELEVDRTRLARLLAVAADDVRTLNDDIAERDKMIVSLEAELAEFEPDREPLVV
jgi:hypothetical protein